MIPIDFITEWRQVAPWPSNHGLEIIHHRIKSHDINLPIQCEQVHYFLSRLSYNALLVHLKIDNTRQNLIIVAYLQQNLIALIALRNLK